MQNTFQKILQAGKVSFFLSSFLLFSCNYTKHLTEDEQLLRKNEIVLENSSDLKNKTALIEGMNSLLNQKPNTHLLDENFLPRYKLWRYNARYEYFKEHPKDDKIKSRKVEAPVIISKRLITRSDTVLKQFMINNGYYNAEVSDTTIALKNKESKVVYKVKPGKPFFIRKISYQTDNLAINNIIEQARDKSYLKVGNIFRNTDFGAERERLYRLLREEGYYAIKSENIWGDLVTKKQTELANEFEIDFTFDKSDTLGQEEDDSLNVFVHLTKTRDPNFDKRFSVGKVQVTFKEYQLEADSTAPFSEEFQNIQFVYHHLPVNKRVIAENVFIRTKDYFSSEAETTTYNRLNQLGTFQFVNIQFDRSVLDSTVLDCYITLTLAPRQDIQFNTDISNSGDYFLGFGLGVNYNTKNLWRGANRLKLSTNYSIEARLDDDKSQNILKRLYLNANNFNVSANLSFPKFLSPIKIAHSRNNYPFTVISLSYSRINRLDVFRIINTSATFSYSWKETKHKSWLFSPIFLSYTRVPSDLIGAAFQERLNSSPTLRNTYANNFIQGESITFEYKSDLTGAAVNSHTLKLGFEEAGLLMQGVNSIYKSFSNDSISPLAHYLRSDIDYRFYRTKPQHQWASRAMIGFGLPTFGNTSLPYIKQYSQGGAFSNRGWRLRSLGPGRQALDTTSIRQLVDRTGDIKLELNTEYRFNIAPIFGGAFNLNGAAFLDAGNIWTWTEDSTSRGAKINPTYIWQDMAISAGLGLRLDFSFFVFRFDHGWPLKHPYILKNSGWDLNGLKLNSGQWHLAIGYPF